MPGMGASRPPGGPRSGCRMMDGLPDLRLPAIELAPLLLGSRLVRLDSDGRRRSGIVVETEAYPGGADLARSHGGWPTDAEDRDHVPRGRRGLHLSDLWDPRLPQRGLRSRGIRGSGVDPSARAGGRCRSDSGCPPRGSRPRSSSRPGPSLPRPRDRPFPGSDSIRGGAAPPGAGFFARARDSCHANRDRPVG